MNAPAHIPYLDGWRGLAIVCVLLGHFTGNLTGSPVIGWLGPFGVALFFALSGRLMGELLFVRKVALTDFFVRRASRVIPTFWLFILAMAAATLALPAWQVDGMELLSTLAFLRTYLSSGASMLDNGWPIGHIWSLNVEEHTYVWLALCAWLARASGTSARWTLLASCAVLLGVVLYYMVQPPEGPTRWQMRTEAAALGIVAAAAIRCLPPLRSRLVLPLLCLACALSALCFSTYTHKSAQLWFSPFCLGFAINYLDRLPAPALRMLAAPWLRWFGRCSFSLYLWQQPFFVAANQQSLPPALALAGALGCGALSFYLFEEPLRRYLNRAWAGRSRRPAHTDAPPADAERSAQA